MKRVCSLLALLTVAALTLAACGEDKVTSSSVESEIKKAAKESGVSVKSVSCPDDIPAKKGSNVACKVTYADGGATETVVAVQQGEGKFKIEFPEQKAAEDEEEAPADEEGEDEATIRALFAELDKDPSQLCSTEFATEKVLSEFDSEEECVDAVDISPPTKVTSLEVAEDGTAEAVVVDESDEESLVNLVFDEKNGWLIDKIE